MKDTARQEVELKRLLLGEHAADRLLAALGPATADKQQVNHFFDTADGRLRQAHHTVRLRFENGTPVLTAKGPGKNLGADTSAREEAETKIDATVAAAILAGRRDPVDELRTQISEAAFEPLWQKLAEIRSGLALQEVGAFENRRRVVPVRLPSGLELEVEVDQTRFPDGHVDEEVEIELPGGEVLGEVEAWLLRKASEASVTTAASSAKVARFYAHSARLER